MWISGPITTVHDEHICHELTAVARISLATRRWLSETSRSAAVVLGNHPISVRLQAELKFPMRIKAMRYAFQSPLIAFTILLGTATSGEARPPGVPSQHCSEISRPRPGTLCYVVHDDLGGKATAGGSPAGGNFIIQPQAGNYVVDSTAIEVTSQAGNGTHSKQVLSIGASVNSINGYQSKLQELDRVINELEGRVAGACGGALCEAKNRLTYLKERRAEYATFYQTAVSAGRDAPKTQYTWSASSRKCGWANLDTCGSWFNFRVYEVRRYVGDPIAEYNALIVPAINQTRSAIAQSSSERNDTPINQAVIRAPRWGGLCLDIANPEGKGPRNGAPVLAIQCHGGNNQSWSLGTFNR